jgi:hypothetical protein
MTSQIICSSCLFAKLLEMQMPDSTSLTVANFTVTNPEAAAYLSNPHKAVYLYPFIGKERTASQVALEYHTDLRAYLYQIGRMQRLGLLKHTKTQKRKGSPVKYYRASADAFFVPLSATKLEGLEAMVDAWSQSLQPVFLKSFIAALQATDHNWGVRIARDAFGRLQIAPAANPNAALDLLAPDVPVMLEGWFTDLHLDHADAKAFQHELVQLYLRYLGKSGAQRYIIRMAIAPMDKGALPPAW